MRRTTLLVTAMVVAATLASGVLVGDDTASAQSATAVPGTTITVNTKGDGTKSGNCTLREAILAANTNATVDRCKAGSATERDAIHFALGKKAKTIVLESQLPDITDPSGLRINGREASITISGNEQVRVFEVAGGAQLALSNLTVADGSANVGGGLFNNGGTVKVGNTAFSNNSVSSGSGGGGIFNNVGTLTVTNSTFSENSADVGGGIFNTPGSTLTVTNSTFSENSASQGGGGIFNNDSVGAAAATLRNTIVANSTSGGNCAGTITDGGYNLDTDGTCVDESVTTSKTTAPRLDPKGLQNNGGPTQTIALLKGSLAINAIPPSVNGCGTDIKTDQRGVSRPQGSGCDIGAYEKK